MSKWDTGAEEFEVGFEAIVPGQYLFQVEEGIKLDVKDTGSQQIMIPFTAIDTKDDDLKDCIGRKLSLFQNLIKKDGTENTMGTRIVAGLLTSLKTAKYFSSKFSDDIPINDEKVIFEMQRVLPGRKILGIVKMGKDMNGNDRPEFKSFKSFKGQAELNGKSGTSGTGKTGSQPASEPGSSDNDDDWG